MAGSLEIKPPRIKQHTFQKIRKKHLDYLEKRFYAENQEAKKWYGSKIEPFLERNYCVFVPSNLYEFESGRKTAAFEFYGFELLFD